MSNKEVIGLSVEIVDAKDYEKLAQKVKGKIVSVIGDEAHTFASYVKANYLSGQKLNVITGATKDSVKTWFEKKKKTWVIRPGVGYVGMLNYLNKWYGTKHEFMRPAFRSYIRGGRLKIKAEEAVNETIKEWEMKSEKRKVNLTN